MFDLYYMGFFFRMGSWVVININYSLMLKLLTIFGVPDVDCLVILEIYDVFFKF
jgi:hypothetical protein